MQLEKIKYVAIFFCIAFVIGYFNPIYGLMISFLIGVGKEIYCIIKKKSTFDFWNLVAYFIGATFGCFVSGIIFHS